MVTRKIIQIDESKCDGCGLCVSACHEGAIQLIDGKARLVKDSYCDGLGACLGECPRGAIEIIEREAEAFSEKEALAAKHQAKIAAPCACPGSAVRNVSFSSLKNWPVQLKLVPPTAPYLDGADLLICADCVPFAYSNFHSEFLNGKVVLVGCPKLDDLDSYYQKLIQIFKHSQPASVTVLKMEVPCCTGIARATEAAVEAAGLKLTVRVQTISIDGKKLNNK